MNIPLRNRLGLVVAEAIVDDEDAALVNRWTWCLNANGYAWRNSVTEPDEAAHVYLHRFLAGSTKGDGLYVDHINRNRMDNRRSNLRIVTPAQAAQNKPALTGRYRGVHWSEQRQRWVATAQLNKKVHHIGRFTTEEEANAAVVAWRLEHMPFAVEDVA